MKNSIKTILFLFLLFLNTFTYTTISGSVNVDGGTSTFGQDGKSGDVILNSNGRKISVNQCLQKYKIKRDDRKLYVKDGYIFLDNQKIIALKDCPENQR
ncbi:hypothetical protein GKC56_05965 [Neisseriaceae bacterium PsAf]|nr:hypothetical protein [Neisseriaceae bacterium PsAf]MCV2502753.1 hypothetical protein [Neisseriaceae bacterium]